MFMQDLKLFYKKSTIKLLSAHSEVENNNYLCDNSKAIRIFNYLGNKFNIK